MPTAFVAGATGFVGRAVVNELRSRGVRVVAHVRPESRRLAEWKTAFAEKGAEVDASPWELGPMTEAIRRAGATHVFGLLGSTRKQARAEGVSDPYETIDYGLTALLCQAAIAAGGSPRFVLLSSIGVREGSGSAYLRAHWKAEEVVRKSGLPWVIARPSFIVPGHGGARRDDGRPLEKTASVVMDGLLAPLGLVSRQTRDRLRSITPERLAAGIARAALEGEPDRLVNGAGLR